MEAYKQNMDIRWSDLDPNFHLRHSVYYDWGAMIRTSFLYQSGLTAAVMLEHHLGPILFHEEARFKREIVFGDVITISLELLRAKHDQSRWAIQHEVYKNGDTLCATIHVEGAWMDTQLRKLAKPPGSFATVFNDMPKSKDFSWLDE